VKPSEAITDFRTTVSGILPHHVRSARPLAAVQGDVSALISGKVLVGHALHNDLKALLLNHPWKQTRDTASYRPFCRAMRPGGPMKPRRLKHLVLEHLGVDIQAGNHDPAEDARAALALYKIRRQEWEQICSKYMISTKTHAIRTSCRR
jgi:RNA exonuclease 4